MIKNIYRALFLLVGFFICSFPLEASAFMSNRVSLNSEVHLGIGSVQLSAETSRVTKEVSLHSQEIYSLGEFYLQNSGSLEGKLSYQISGIPVEWREQICISLYEMTGDGKENKIADLSETGAFQFLKENRGIEPGETRHFKLYIQLQERLNQPLSSDIAAAFILTQKNAVYPESMFYAKAELPVIRVVLEEEQAAADWPTANDDRWITHPESGIRYWSTLNEIMYFSETEDGMSIRNLDDLAVYYEVPPHVSEVTFAASFIDAPFVVKQEVRDQKKGRYKVTISLNEKNKKENENKSEYLIDYYTVKTAYKKSGKNTASSPLVLTGKLRAKRLYISTDAIDYSTNPIITSRDIHLPDEPQYLTLHYLVDYHNRYSALKDADLEYSEITIEVGTDAERVEANVQTDENRIQLKSREHALELSVPLQIALKGTAGETIVLKRNIQLLKTDPAHSWPAVSWESLDGKGTLINKTQWQPQPDSPSDFFPVLFFKSNHYIGFDFEFINGRETMNGLTIRDKIYHPNGKMLMIVFEQEKKGDGVLYNLKHNGVTLNWSQWLEPPTHPSAFRYPESDPAVSQQEEAKEEESEQKNGDEENNPTDKEQEWAENEEPVQEKTVPLLEEEHSNNPIVPFEEHSFQNSTHEEDLLDDFWESNGQTAVSPEEMETVSES